MVCQVSSPRWTADDLTQIYRCVVSFAVHTSATYPLPLLMTPSPAARSYTIYYSSRSGAGTVSAAVVASVKSFVHGCTHGLHAIAFPPHPQPRSPASSLTNTRPSLNLRYWACRNCFVMSLVAHCQSGHGVN